MTPATKPDTRPDSPSLPPNRIGGNKTVLVLLIGGVVILGIAAYVYVNRKPDAQESPTTSPVVEPIYSAPRPLVVEPTRPIVERSPDAGAAVLLSEGDEPRKTPKGRYQEKLGTIDAGAVNSFMSARFEQVRACYERRLKMNPLLEGDVDLNISIATTGKVTGIAVTSDTVRDGEMLDCVRRTIRGWNFPKPEGGRAVVAKNFKFKKKS
jgi:hypothetical protein